MTAIWNPARYEKFKSQRSKPFFELLVGILGEGPYFYPFKRILLWRRKS